MGKVGNRDPYPKLTRTALTFAGSATLPNICCWWAHGPQVFFEILLLKQKKKKRRNEGTKAPFRSPPQSLSIAISQGRPERLVLPESLVFFPPRKKNKRFFVTQAATGGRSPTPQHTEFTEGAWHARKYLLCSVSDQTPGASLFESHDSTRWFLLVVLPCIYPSPGGRRNRSDQAG